VSQLLRKPPGRPGPLSSIRRPAAPNGIHGCPRHPRRSCRGARRAPRDAADAIRTGPGAAPQR
jgi:hypothetical protein